jgi:hypothetical protein
LQASEAFCVLGSVLWAVGTKADMPGGPVAGQLI